MNVMKDVGGAKVKKEGRKEGVEEKRMKNGEEQRLCNATGLITVHVLLP